MRLSTLVLFLPLTHSCQYQYTIEDLHLNCDELIQFYSKTFENYLNTSPAHKTVSRSIVDSHQFVAIPDNSFPIGLPMKITHESRMLPVINSQEHCSPQYIQLIGSPESSLSCAYTSRDELCLCELETVGIFFPMSPVGFERELIDDIHRRFDQLRKLQPLEQIDQSTLLLNNTTLSKERFDIGILTHAVLVVLSLISFAGNALFVIFVFWLSK